jgi:uroporphyrinogen decarboxylase
MNKRDTVLNLVTGSTPPAYVPAAFFLHFDRAAHQGQAAIDRHLEYFRHTGMDFVKIQYEQNTPAASPILEARDWTHLTPYPESFFEPTVRLVEGLVQSAGQEALVVLTLYSPFMWAANRSGDADLRAQFDENPQAVSRGLAIMTENVLTLARACKQAGVDGFYASTQGGESFRFPGTDIFEKYIKPTDLAVWEEIKDCTFNILHVCDYSGGYDDLTPFLEYPGHIVNTSLKLGGRTVTPGQVSQMFGRPFMGGLDRHGVLATGDREAIRQAADDVLRQAPQRFILAADCTVPGETPWDNLKAAVDAAHDYRR